jgi:hypothetical protein
MEPIMRLYRSPEFDSINGLLNVDDNRHAAISGSYVRSYVDLQIAT